MTTAATTETTPVAPPAPPALEAPKPHVKADDLPPDALKTRLAEAEAKAKRELLASLGVTSVEDAARAVADAKAAADAKRSDAEKLAAKDVEAAKVQAQLSEYQAAIDAVWAGEAAKLTDTQREAINEVAGAEANAAAKMRVLSSLRKTWAQPTAATPASPAPAPQTPAPTPPASTTTATPAPAPAGIVSPTDHKAIFENYQKTNPIRAAAYLQQYEREIFPA